MKKKGFVYPLRMWCDILAVGITLFAMGIAGSFVGPFWVSIGVFITGLVGALISIYYLLKEKPLQESPLSKDISMAATYVWPCILSGLIVDHFGIDGLSFYVMAAVIMGVVLLVNHNDLI